MGLDSFWELPGGINEPNFDPPLRLCGGMLSGSGSGSFRGKVYDTLVEAVTGESLYQEVIDSTVVSKMSDSLEGRDYDSLPDDLRCPKDETLGDEVTRAEYGDLRRMFSSYSKLGAILKGWW